MITYTVEPCSRKEVTPFVEEWHYSKSINGLRSSYCFKLMDGKNIVGAAIFGAMGMANTWKKYGAAHDDVIELRRLCCIDDTPRNTESFFIGKMLRWLKKNTDIKTVVSYADANVGHVGTIYKASNFEFVGMTGAGRIIYWNGKKFHDKTIRTKYKGELKPFAARVKAALESGEAYYIKLLPKYTYIYRLER